MPPQTIQAPGYTPSKTAAQVIGPTEQQYNVLPGQPAATAPATPAPSPASPGVPAAPQIGTPTAPQTSQNAPGQAQPALTMPGTGSVVDLLNMAGQDSSFAAREQLAAKYGIQGYSGTAQQNQDLSKKYLDAYNANKGKPVPDTGAQATSAIDTYFKDTAPETQEDPQRAFFDQYMAMNPVVKTMYDSINQMLSTPATTQTFKQEYDSLLQTQGIQGLQTELMNIKNIMDGTEDDLRTEISKAGGLATESQVAALAGARNKTLLKQANVLQQQLALKEDYVNQIMQFSKLDRAQVEKDVDRKLGLTEKLAGIQEKMTIAAKDNYKNIVGEVGYDGLANILKDDKQAQKLAEKTLGLPSGSLADPARFKKAVEPKPLQFVPGTDNQQSGIFNPTTGVFTPRSGGGGSGSGSGGGGVPGTVSGSIARDADSVMSGNLNLQDISVKDNYRAQVAAEINKKAQVALATGDIYGVMRASAAYDKEPSDTFTTSMEKLGTVLGQIGVLQENIDSGSYIDENGKKRTFSTGPIVGAFKSKNPWDTKAQTIKAQLNAIVPNLARGIYGEVGVLTDNDIANYAKTLPNLTSTEDIRNAVLYITVDMIRKNAEIKIKNQAAAQRDMSGYAGYYKDIVNQSNAILAKLPGSSSPSGGAITTGTLPNGTKVFKKADGSITDAQGNKYDSNGNKLK